MDDFVEELKENIKRVYNETTKCVDKKIKRGHKRSISTEVENEIAKLILKELQNITIFIDPTITINNKTYRPDMLVLNSSKEVMYYLEIKANMGYCRDARPVISDMIAANNSFLSESELVCKFKIDSNTNKYEKESIIYSENVKLYLISLTEENSSPSTWYKINLNYGKERGIEYYNLFSNWYNALTDKGIYDFILSLKDKYKMEKNI